MRAIDRARRGDEGKSSKQVAGGVLLGIALNAIAFFVFARNKIDLLPLFGLIQMTWIIPAIIGVSLFKRTAGMANGLALVTALTFLANAACFGLVMCSV